MTAQPKFTQGPLFVHEELGGIYVVKPPHAYLGQAFGMNNAVLWAAAPDMHEALLASEREYADMGEDAPLDPGCRRCTHNTTPHDRDTGLCAHHLRVAALAKAVQP